MTKLSKKKRRALIIELAKEQFEREGELEIDSNAKLSEGDDNGTYVQAWVWLPFAGTQFCKGTESMKGKVKHNDCEVGCPVFDAES